MGELEKQRPHSGAVATTMDAAVTATAASPVGAGSNQNNMLVWVAFSLGLASAIPGMVLGLFGLPLGLAAAAVSAIALLRLTSRPPDERRGEMLTLMSLGIGVFQVVFVLVGFYFVNLG